MHVCASTILGFPFSRCCYHSGCFDSATPKLYAINAMQVGRGRVNVWCFSMLITICCDLASHPGLVNRLVVTSSFVISIINSMVSSAIWD